METSAKASVNVEEAFHTLARDIKTKTEKKLVCLLEIKFIQYLLVTITNSSKVYKFHEILYISFLLCNN